MSNRDAGAAGRRNQNRRYVYVRGAALSEILVRLCVDRIDRSPPRLGVGARGSRFTLSTPHIPVSHHAPVQGVRRGIAAPEGRSGRGGTPNILRRT